MGEKKLKMALFLALFLLFPCQQTYAKDANRTTSEIAVSNLNETAGDDTSEDIATEDSANSTPEENTPAANATTEENTPVNDTIVSSDTDDYVQVNTGDWKTTKDCMRLIIMITGISLVFVGLDGLVAGGLQDEEQ